MCLGICLSTREEQLGGVFGRVMVLEEPWLGFAQALLGGFQELLEGGVVLTVVLSKKLVQGGILRTG